MAAPVPLFRPKLLLYVIIVPLALALLGSWQLRRVVSPAPEPLRPVLLHTGDAAAPPAAPPVTADESRNVENVPVLRFAALAALLCGLGATYTGIFGLYGAHKNARRETPKNLCRGLRQSIRRLSPVLGISALLLALGGASAFSYELMNLAGQPDKDAASRQTLLYADLAVILPLLLAGFFAARQAADVSRRLLAGSEFGPESSPNTGPDGDLPRAEAQEEATCFVRLYADISKRLADSKETLENGQAGALAFLGRPALLFADFCLNATAPAALRHGLNTLALSAPPAKDGNTRAVAAEDNAGADWSAVSRLFRENTMLSMVCCLIMSIFLCITAALTAAANFGVGMACFAGSAVLLWLAVQLVDRMKKPFITLAPDGFQVGDMQEHVAPWRVRRREKILPAALRPRIAWNRVTDFMSGKEGGLYVFSIRLAEGFTPPPFAHDRRVKYDPATRLLTIRVLALKQPDNPAVFIETFLAAWRDGVAPSAPETSQAVRPVASDIPATGRHS